MVSFSWLAIAAILGIIEAVSLTLVTIWFVIGGLAAFATAQLGFPIEIQIVVFIGVSVISLFLFRPLVLKHRAQGQMHEASLVGQQALVTESISATGMTGRVETNDHMTWAAISADNDAIEEGSHVLIIGNESIKLIVRAID